MRPRAEQAISLITHSPEQTRSLGRRLALLAQPGDVIALTGDLGAGKTTLVQGLAEGLETREPATSPSFTLLHDHPGKLRLYHLDLYRLSPDHLVDLGVEEVMDGNAVVAVEWAERLPQRLRTDGLDIAIEFEASDDNIRRLLFTARGERGRRLLDALREEGHARARD